MADYAPVQETLAAPAGPPIDPDVLEQRRKLAQALIAQAMGGEPIGSWTQGIANLAQALMGGYNVRKTNQQEATGRASGAADTASVLAELAGGGTADLPGTEAVSTAPSADVTDFLGGGGKGNAGYVYQGMLRRGASPAGAAAFAASMQQESGFNPSAHNPGEGAIGGIQWRGPRAAGLKAFAAAQGKKWNADLDTQMDYAVHEMQTSEAGAGQAFFNAKTPEEANRALKAYIRYGDKAGPAGSAGWDYRKRLGNTRRILEMQGGGGGETADLSNVDPVSAAPTGDVAQFLGMMKQAQPPSTPQDALQPIPNTTAPMIDELRRAPQRKYAPEWPAETDPADLMRPLSGDPIAGQQLAMLEDGRERTAGSSVGDPRIPRPRPEPPPVAPYADPRTPQPRPDLAQALALPPASGRGTVPLPPVHPLARQPQPRPQPPAPAPAPAPAAAAPATTASIPQPQPRRQIFREPYPSVLSAQEFARQGQNYLTGRGSFANQTPRVAPRTMQEPIGGGAPGGAPAAAPAQPRRGLLAALLGRGGPQAPAAAQAAPAGSPVTAGATAVPAAAPAGGVSSRVSALLANPYVSDAVKSAVLARLMPKQQDPFTLGPDEKRYDANGNLIAEGGAGARKIQNDANGVPRYTDTGEPVYAGDEGTGGEFFTGKSVEAQGLNFLINQGTLTKEQAANVAAGKTITAADGSLIFMTPAGIVRKPPGSDATGGDDGGYVISGPKTAGTEAETKAGGFADRMRESGRIIDALETEGTSLAGRAVGDIPILGNYLVSDKYRQYQQAQRDFINSQLRRESGAVISDAEFENAKKQYFPQPNDDAKTIANKRRNRALAVEGMKRSAGPLYKPAQEEAPAAPAAPIEKGAPGSSKETAVHIGSEADYNRLPSGAYYVDDDGSIKVKS